MKDFEILKVLDEAFKKKYEPTNKLETVGHSISGTNAILNYKDGDIEIKIKCSKKVAIQQMFDYMKSKGKLKNIDFEKFEEKYNEGVEISQIEEEVRKGQLPGMDK